MVSKEELRRVITPMNPVRRSIDMDKVLDVIIKELIIKKKRDKPLGKLIRWKFRDFPFCSRLSDLSDFVGGSSPFYLVAPEVTYCAGRSDYAVLKCNPLKKEKGLIMLVVELGDIDPEKLHRFALFKPDYEMWHFPYVSAGKHYYIYKTRQVFRKEQRVHLATKYLAFGRKLDTETAQRRISRSSHP